MVVSYVLSFHYCALIMGAYIIICSCFYRNDKINLFCIRSFPIFVEYKIRLGKNQSIEAIMLHLCFCTRLSLYLYNIRFGSANPKYRSNDASSLFLHSSLDIFVKYKIRLGKESFDGIYCLDFSRVRTECIYVEL